MADSAIADAAAPVPRPDMYLIISNIAKKMNLGMMIRSACAFGAKCVMVVGGSQRFATFGAHGTTKYVPTMWFPKLNECIAYLKERDVTICGVEIVPQAVSIASHPFTGSTAFLMGNEGDGLSPAQMSLCDRFVYIPHYGNGTASLNVSVAASIIMHHFGLWAGYAEHSRSAVADKYDVAPPDYEAARHTESAELKRNQRAVASADDSESPTGARNEREISQAQLRPPKDALGTRTHTFTRENRWNLVKSERFMEAKPDIGNESSNQSSFKDGKTPSDSGGDVPNFGGHSRIHLSRDLTAEEKSHVAEMRKLWRERESAKPFDPMSLIERTGITYVPPAYTKETFEKLQKLFVDEVLKLQAESRADKADKDKVLAELESLEEKLSEISRQRDDAVTAAEEWRAQQLAAGRRLGDAQAALDAALLQLNSANSTIDSLRAQLVTVKDDADKRVADAETAIGRQLAAARTEAEQLRLQLQSASSEAQQGAAVQSAELAKARAEIARLQKQLKQAKAMVPTAVTPASVPHHAPQVPTHGGRQPLSQSKTANRRMSDIVIKPRDAGVIQPPKPSAGVPSPAMRRQHSPIRTPTSSSGVSPLATSATNTPGPVSPVSPARTTPPFASPRSQSAVRSRRRLDEVLGVASTPSLEGRPPWRYYATPSHANE